MEPIYNKGTVKISHNEFQVSRRNQKDLKIKMLERSITMLEIYNYVIGILIGILFSFSNHNESKIIIIKNCLITTVIYAISMSLLMIIFF